MFDALILLYNKRIHDIKVLENDKPILEILETLHSII